MKKELEDLLGPRYEVTKSKYTKSLNSHTVEFEVKFNQGLESYGVKFSFSDFEYYDWKPKILRAAVKMIKNQFEPVDILQEYEDMIKELDDKASD